MLKLLTSFICCFFWVTVYAQTIKIAGTVASTGKPVFAATITLWNAIDSVYVKGAVTDTAGHFIIQASRPGDYRLKVTCLGYQSYLGRSFTVPSSGVNLGRIELMVAQGSQLQEVAIRDKKPFAEHRIDRTVINPDALAVNQGASALDVLETAPGVFIDPVSGAISLEGKRGITVYIDDRKSYLSGNDLLAYLQSLPSGTLQQIELMTNPTARYDAGSGGVIIIRLKKNRVKGFNGIYTQLYGHWYYGKAEEEGHFDYRTGKFNLAFNIDDNQQNWRNNNDQNRAYLNPDGSTRSFYALDNFTHGQGYTLLPQLSLDYYATDKTTWGINLSDLYRTLTATGQTLSSFADQSGQPDSTLNQYFTSPRVISNFSGNLNFRHQYDKKGHELTADFDYNRFNIQSSQLFTNSTTLPNQTLIAQSQETDSTPTYIDVYAFKSDYSRSLKSGLKLETGLKTSFIRTDNPADYFHTVNGITSPEYDKTNRFVYHENINAAYINATKDWKRFAAELGLRAENTHISGDQSGNAAQPGSTFERQYTGLFPTLFLQYKLDPAGANQFRFSYGRRIRRPAYQSLNPFIVPEDRYNDQVGNPDLQASYAQNLEFAFSHQNLTVKLFYTKTTGDAQTVNTLVGDIIYSTFANLGYAQREGFSISGSFGPVNWFSLNGYADIRLEQVQGMVGNTLITVNGPHGSLQGNAQFKAGKDWNFALNGFYVPTANSFQRRENGTGRINVVIQKKISDHFSARATLSDPLNIYHYSGTNTNLTGTRTSYYNTFDSRGFNISLTYKFGKAIKDLRQHRSDASSDEQSRIKN